MSKRYEKKIKKNIRRSRGGTARRKGRHRLAGTLLLLFIAVVLGLLVYFMRSEDSDNRGNLKIRSLKPAIDVQLLEVNEYSRPGIQVEKVDGIVIHYTANPMASAQQNRDYFDSLAQTHSARVSSNFIVGLQGEIIQCIPTWEVAYASNNRNGDTISIECCHEDQSGYFNADTYRSVVQLTAWLCNKYGLSADQVIRHYDVTGKNCPKYFVEHEDAWEAFKKDVAYAIDHPK